MLFLDMKTVILNVTMLYESNHAVQYTASGFYRLELVLVFTANHRPGMNTVIWKSAITKICFQLGYRCRDIHRLVTRHHGNDVNNKAGNIPALDGPGSYDQPPSVT